ncbi:hypothetical protein BHE74_00059322, partial [Ensete ventricosum]
MLLLLHCRFSLEMHMVHQSADNKTAVVGILYKAGLPDPFIRQDYENNARPRQMINGRLIGFYRPPKHEN